MTKKGSNKVRRNPFLKKELLAASIVVLSGAGQKSEAKTAEAQEARIEVYAAPAENMETEATFELEMQRDNERYVYDRKLSKGLSNRFEGAYVNMDTREVLLKYADPYKEPYMTNIRACVEDQKMCIGPYDRSGDKRYQHDEGHFVYDRRLSRNLSVKYSRAYVNYETEDVILKAASRYDEDYRTTIRGCREAQKLGIGPYDRSRDREIRRELIENGEYGRRAVVEDVVRGLTNIIRSHRGR